MTNDECLQFRRSSVVLRLSDQRRMVATLTFVLRPSSFVSKTTSIAFVLFPTPHDRDMVYSHQPQRSVLIIRHAYDQSTPDSCADRRPRSGLPRVPCARQ